MFSECDLTAFWDLAIRFSSSKVTDFANNDMVLSSVKLCTDAFLMPKKRSFRTTLNIIGPTIELCGTPKLYL